MIGCGADPAFVADGGEADPARVVGVNLVPFEHVGEQLPDRCDRLFVGLPRSTGAIREGREAGLLPHREVISTMKVLPEAL